VKVLLYGMYAGCLEKKYSFLLNFSAIPTKYIYFTAILYIIA